MCRASGHKYIRLPKQRIMASAGASLMGRGGARTHTQEEGASGRQEGACVRRLHEFRIVCVFFITIFQIILQDGGWKLVWKTSSESPPKTCRVRSVERRDGAKEGGMGSRGECLVKRRCRELQVVYGALLNDPPAGHTHRWIRQWLGSVPRRRGNERRHVLSGWSA